MAGLTGSRSRRPLTLAKMAGVVLKSRARTSKDFSVCTSTSQPPAGAVFLATTAHGIYSRGISCKRAANGRNSDEFSIGDVVQRLPDPVVVTDQNGRATIAIPLADSITTWRMAMMASTAHGALGSGTSSLKVFQDFFVDLDLPVTLTQGDRVSIPVAAYNYSAARGDVSLQLQNDDWFRLVEDVSDKTLAVDAGRVGGAQYTIEAKRIGKFKLTLSARMAGGAREANAREPVTDRPTGVMHR